MGEPQENRHVASYEWVNEKKAEELQYNTITKKTNNKRMRHTWSNKKKANKLKSVEQIFIVFLADRPERGVE